MTARNITPPYPVFLDRDGTPLDNGFVYIGVENLGPVTNPIPVYWDEALTIPASQPIRTINGYPSRAGTPSALFADSVFSITVRDSKGLFVYSSMSVTDIADDTLRSDLAASSGSSLVGFIQSGTGAVARTVQEKGREVVSLKDFGAIGDGITNDTAAIDAALAASSVIEVPPGIFMTDGGHDLTGKVLIGLSPYVSTIKLRGSNTGVVMFRNAQTDASNPGIWGTGLDLRLENLSIVGNWDGTSGLTAGVGVQQGDYHANTNTGLIKVISSARVFIKNCRVSYAYEHGILIYRSGYSEISSNLIYANRGSGIWATADTANTSNTSTSYIANRVESNRGYYGNMRMKYMYGCYFAGNLLEAGNWNWYLEEGKECCFTGNYAEAGVLGDIYIDPAIWGYTFNNDYWTVQPTIPSSNGGRGIIINNAALGLVVQRMFGASNAAKFQAFLSTVGGAIPFDKRLPIRMEGSGIDGSDYCAMEIALEANYANSVASRIAFRTHNGTDFATRAYIDERGNYYAPNSTYQNGHVILGAYHVWVSTDGKLRIKNGVPVGDTDGTIVGTQL